MELPTPTFDVILDDGTQHRIQVTNADFLRWDKTASKHGWPEATKAPFLWNTFVCWAALRRTGALDDTFTWEQFEQRAASIHMVTGDELNGQADAVDPFSLAAVRE